MLTRISTAAMARCLLEKLGAERPLEAPHADEEESQQEQPQPQRPPHPLLTAGKALGAYGLGTAVGYGGMLGANELSKAVQRWKGVQNPRPLMTSKSPIMHALPALAGVGTVAFQHAQQSLFDRMREDEAKRRELSGK